MTLEDERTSWKHREQLERGDTPLTSEGEAAARLASLIGTHLDRRYVTDRLVRDIAAKVIAARDNARSIFDELDADPRAIAQRDKVLRQQPTAAHDQYDWHLELAAEAKQAWVDHCAQAEAIRHQRLAEFDVDARDADRSDDRAREQRQDDHANREAVRP